MIYYINTIRISLLKIQALKPWKHHTGIAYSRISSTCTNPVKSFFFGSKEERLKVSVQLQWLTLQTTNQSWCGHGLHFNIHFKTISKSVHYHLKNTSRIKALMSQLMSLQESSLRPGEWLTSVQFFNLYAGFLCVKEWTLKFNSQFTKYVSDLLLHYKLSRPLRWSDQVSLLSPESKLNTQKQHSVFLHHISGTNSRITLSLCSNSLFFFLNQSLKLVNPSTTFY